MSEFAATAPARRAIPIATWLTLGAFALGVWPWFTNIQSEFANGLSGVAETLQALGFGPSGLSFLDFLLLPIFEPLVMIAAVILAFVAKGKVLRAIPGFLYGAGFVLFFILNALTLAQPHDYEGNAWDWTVGLMPQAAFYVGSIVLAVVASVMAVLEKSPASGTGTVHSAGNASRQPVAFDTNTGQPIYGYDTQTGAPIY